MARRLQLHLASQGQVEPDANLLRCILRDIPSVGRNVQNFSDERTVSFSDVGGMRDVKRRLTEIFLWPAKYSELYAKCGVASGHGAILHGPSGCGKTLILKALATEARLNVITVKGPELLSKYIGSSEENVRKVFERARTSRPSLIVFDEFDALAPMRGHDNTGVTDRVVNQLLTELDGVDSSMEGMLETYFTGMMLCLGVFVVAATNRIELIDAALLRPGRFDHKVFVALPTMGSH
ncbi:ATPaseAAA family protein [Aphelenchoides avenae]|nr:ATPaseAAA family protein [Aphelenchus avenae]